MRPRKLRCAAITGLLLVVVAAAVAGGMWITSLAQMQPHMLLAYSSMFITRTNPPVVSVQDHFPDAALLEANWRDIAQDWRDVAMALDKRIPEYKEIDPYQDISKTGAWRMFMFRLMYLDVPGNVELCPRTRALLHHCRGVRNAFFSILEPGAHLPAHIGPLSSVYRYHLGIVVPEPDKCELVVDGVSLRWHEGEGFLWDDRYMHTSTNHGTKPRVVLFLDVDRRDISWLGWFVDAVVVRVVQAQPFFIDALRRAAPLAGS